MANCLTPKLEPPSLPATLALIPVLLVLALGSTGCARSDRSLRIGANIWPGYEPMFLARHLGYFEGFPVKLIDFSSSAEVTRAYRNRLIDVAALTADEALVAAEGENNHRIVLTCDFSVGADVLIAKPGLQSVGDLKGRRIGLETTVLGAYMLARALELNALSPGDVRVVPVPLPEHETAFNAGKVDAIVTFEPHRSRLLAAGGRVLFDSTQIRGEIVDVLLTRRDLAESQNRALTEFVSAWFRALAYLRKYPSDAAARVCEREGVMPHEYLASLRGIEFPDRQTNLRLLGNSPDSLTGALRQLSAVMCREKFVPKAIEPPLLDASFVQGAEP